VKVSKTFLLCKISFSALNRFKKVIFNQLTINRGDSFSNTAISSLSKAFPNLTSLKNLTLNFLQCPDITDEAMSGLGQGLRDLISLQNISLNFSE